MEATDLDLVENVARKNAVMDGLNGKHPIRFGMALDNAVRDTYVEPMPEDETYAARYHRAYQQKGK